MIIEFEGKCPQIGENVFIAPNATIIGDVIIGDNSNVWFGAVIRGDNGPIRIGKGCSIQDNAVVHVAKSDSGEVLPTIIGDYVTLGHNISMEACTIGDRTVIGMNAVVLPHAEVGSDVMIAAGSVVREGQQIEDKVLVAGVPAKVKGPISENVQQIINRNAPGYVDLQARYRKQGIDKLPLEHN